MKGPHSPATISERPGFGSATSRTNKSALVLWNTPQGNQSSVTGKYYVILRWNHCEWGVWATKPLSLPLGGNTGALLLSLPPTSDWWFHSLNKIFRVSTFQPCLLLQEIQPTELTSVHVSFATTAMINPRTLLDSLSHLNSFIHKFQWQDYTAYCLFSIISLVK